MFRGRTLTNGYARSPSIRLTESLSFWGGMDSDTGLIIDRHHPQRGSCITNKILVMPSGRGSCSSSSVLAEAIRRRTAPSGILLLTADPIITAGATVAAFLYGFSVPVLELAQRDWELVPEGAEVEISAVDSRGFVVVNCL
jgi:uncharacterized protein